MKSIMVQGFTHELFQCYQNCTYEFYVWPSPLSVMVFAEQSFCCPGWMKVQPIQCIRTKKCIYILLFCKLHSVETKIESCVVHVCKQPMVTVDLFEYSAHSPSPIPALKLPFLKCWHFYLMCIKSEYSMPFNVPVHHNSHNANMNAPSVYQNQQDFWHWIVIKVHRLF